MTDSMQKLGLAATTLIVLLLGFNMLREPFRQRDSLTAHQYTAIANATVHYATYCVECHGTLGEGLNQNPALNNHLVRHKTHEELFKTIERGRLNTAMVAFGASENGILTSTQIDDLVTLIQYGSWREVQTHIVTQGLAPTAIPPIEQQFDLAALSHPLEIVSAGRDVYLANCFSCHNPGATGITGHSIGKDLIANEFVQQSADDELLTFIQEGRTVDDPVNVTGYAMPARADNPILSDDDILNAIAYLRELDSGAAALSVAAVDHNPIGTWDGVSYRWVEVANNLDSPLYLTHAGDGSGRLFIVEQTGLIMIVNEGMLLPNPFLDVADLLPLRVYQGGYTEQGLLGLAFHPNYVENGHFFISYTNRQGASVIARYNVLPDNPNRADPTSGVILLTVDQPFADHNGGDIVFGPDSYLYIGLGDGGRPSEPNYFSQEPLLYLGKMLRIDVNTEPYAVPEDNPFVDDLGYLPEIWALGLRNPWRFSFDRQTGDLYIADVGQWRIEEINFQPASSVGGENYGWSAFEGPEPYLEDETLLGEHTPPVLHYGHEVGLSITGGYVYRGKALLGLHGLYFYGDYIGGLVWLAGRDVAGDWYSESLMDTGFVISSFGEDESGELYLVDYKGGVYRLEAVAAPAVDTPAEESSGNSESGG